MEWINIKDKLPEADAAVLCYCNHQNVFQEHIKWKHINIGSKHSYDNDFTMENDDTTFINVSHWMPLPKAPQS